MCIGASFNLSTHQMIDRVCSLKPPRAMEGSRKVSIELLAVCKNAWN